MTGLWLVSYSVLWILFILACFLLFGMLQQIGTLQRQLKFSGEDVKQEFSGAGERVAAKPEEDGPPPGVDLPELAFATINGFGTLSPTTFFSKSTLLVFLSSMCETCQAVVEPLNRLVDEEGHHLKIVVIMRNDAQTCRTFLKLFPLQMPVVCDSSHAITMGLNVHSSPFGLLYDTHGSLTKKGLLRGQEDLQLLLTTPLAVSNAQQ
jgi:hypothetical protein